MGIRALGLRRSLFAILFMGSASSSTLVEIDFARPWVSPVTAEAPATIRPVWARQNVWMPWKRWDRARPPKFEPFVTEIALVMPTGARPDGEFSVPDLYRDSAGTMAAFDLSHPLFRALAILKSQGLRPMMDIGPVPAPLCRPDRRTPGPFGWVTDAPTDYEKYYRYIKALFTQIRAAGPFTAEEMDGWGYQLLREPDNGDAWNPRWVQGVSDPGNMLEYERLYDCTLAGMRDAGITANLAPGNLLVIHAGMMRSKDAWAAPLFGWLASGKENRCPDHLTLPRIRSEKDTLDFSFSAYGGEGSQIGEDPRNLERIVDRFRLTIRRFFPHNPIRITVAESNLFTSRLLHRSEGSEMGAAWNAAVFKIALDAGLHRFVQWGFVSSDHISKFTEHGGLPSATANVVGMFRRMEGETRTAVRLRRRGLSLARPYIDAIASKDKAGTRHVLLYHYLSSRGSSAQERVQVGLKGLEPGRAYGLKAFRVDAGHANYLPALERDLKTKGLSVETADACMEYQFGASERAVWEANKETYRKLARLEEAREGFPAVLKANAEGRAEAWLNLPANGVVLLELKP
ncbi:MAG: hypothetical protein M3Y08_04210 [Fibrobacterota bacterium]|nr:hypothetical protein [Fibrobacterota bacterium]